MKKIKSTGQGIKRPRFWPFLCQRFTGVLDSVTSTLWISVYPTVKCKLSIYVIFQSIKEFQIFIIAPVSDMIWICFWSFLILWQGFWRLTLKAYGTKGRLWGGHFNKQGKRDYLRSFLPEIGKCQKVLNSLSGSGHLIDTKILCESKTFFFLLFTSLS